MNVRQTIAELTSQLGEINYDSDEDYGQEPIKDAHQHEEPLSDENILHDDIQPSKLRRNTHSLSLPDKVYGGKTTSRRKNSTFSESGSDSEKSVLNQSDGEGSFSDASNKGKEDSSEESEIVSGDDSALSDDETNKTASSKPDAFDLSQFKTDIYSAGSKNVTNDIKKGVAIKNQIRIWENLLECRIKLQKGLIASNNLPPTQQLLEAKFSLNEDDQTRINKCKKDLLTLLGKLIDIQDVLLKQSSEFKKTKSWSSSAGMDEEIKSDSSDFEDEKEENDSYDPAKKRRKLNDYSSAIKEHHNRFTPFKNASIQKWNDKTKVSTGKMASSNFSAFDQSTLKQIEQIMADKTRLINRTRIKRQGNMNSDSKDNEELGKDNQDLLDPETFDDTDFYHKLLRDYIERKSVDVVGSSQTERQMIELQKLRSKMKKNVDTKSTKGRKLRYVVLPKLVNFMAPHPYHSWSEQAENELYSSLFGKIKVVS